MSRQFLVDLDGTVIASPPCDGTREGIAAWERAIVESPPPPVPGALDGLRRLLDEHHAFMVDFVTARSSRLQATTRWWLGHHAPWLNYTLGMGFAAACSGGVHHKVKRLMRLIEDAQDSVILIDDDARLSCLLRAGDEFRHAPGCWR